MPYVVETDRDNQTIIARVSGRATHDEHRAAREKAAQSCFDNGFKRLLVDLRNVDTTGVSTPESTFEFGELLAGDARLKNIRIAHLMPKQLLSRIDVDFVASIAEIRGKTTGRFATPEDAMQWLKAL